MSGDPRTDQLRDNMLVVEERLAAACAASGRARDEVTLIAVTKTFPADDVRRLVALGVLDIGENRDQEASRKSAELSDVDARWHFIGQLQSNKCRSVAAYADVVHSVDRDRIVGALSTAATEIGRIIDVFVQVSLDQVGDGDPQRGGAAPGDVAALADHVASAPSLRLVGVMAVAPLITAGTAASSQQTTGDAFRRLADIAAMVRSAHPEATAISAGMSADMEVAIATGATHVRIGTALLGGRPPPVR
jgi:pyridoxal phosphate enzyme (YggS family)